MILQYPRTHGRVYKWARAYATLFHAQGQLAAGRYANTTIPKQFHKTLTVVAREEYEEIERKKSQ